MVPGKSGPNPAEKCFLGATGRISATPWIFPKATGEGRGITDSGCPYREVSVPAPGDAKLRALAAAAEEGNSSVTFFRPPDDDDGMGGSGRAS